MLLACPHTLITTFA